MTSGCDESGDGIFPAIPPLAVTRLEDVQARLMECEDALRYAEEECARRGERLDKCRQALKAIYELPCAYPDRPDEGRLIARNFAVAQDWAGDTLRADS